MNYNTDQRAHVKTGVIRRPFKEISLEASLIISSILHVFSPLAAYLGYILLVFLLALLGIHLALFQPSQPKVRDIEFKIVSAPEQKPLVETKNRAERNTRAGGKHDPNKPESEPEPKAAKAKAQPQPKPAKPQPVVKPKPATKPQPKQVAQKPQQQPVQQPPKPQQKPEPPKQQPPVPIPPVAKAPVAKAPIAPIGPPVKIASAPKSVGPSTNIGPITKNDNSTTASNSGTSGPAPVTINSPAVSGSRGNTASGSPGSSSKGSTGSSSYGSGNPGNPSAGNPKGAPGINAKRDPDFGPYMAELQRRIKRNWQPPRKSQSKRVVVLFTVAKDGRLLNMRVNRSSGEPDADNAAISAVQLSAPFRPLPSEFSGGSIDIQFTFDYNVFGVGGRTF